MDLKLVYICIFIKTMCYNTYEALEYAVQTDQVSDDDVTSEDKRTGMRPYPFPCNGYDNMPRCLHGGKGPRKTWTKSGRFCVCLCPPKWVGAECGHAMDSGMGKREFSDFDSLAFSEDDKRNYGPWQAIPGEKRPYGPWQVVRNEDKRGIGPWQVIPSSDKSKRTPPFPWTIVNEKRPYPWRVWENPSSNEAGKKRVHPWNPTIQNGAVRTSIPWRYQDGSTTQKRYMPWQMNAHGTSGAYQPISTRDIQYPVYN